MLWECDSHHKHVSLNIPQYDMSVYSTWNIFFYNTPSVQTAGSLNLVGILNGSIRLEFAEQCFQTYLQQDPTGLTPAETQTNLVAWQEAQQLRCRTLN